MDGCPGWAGLGKQSAHLGQVGAQLTDTPVFRPPQLCLAWWLPQEPTGAAGGMLWSQIQAVPLEP